MTTQGCTKEHLIPSLLENSKNKKPIPSCLFFAVFRDAAVHLLDVNSGFLFPTCSFIHSGSSGHEAQVPLDFQNEIGEQRDWMPSSWQVTNIDFLLFYPICT